MFKHIARIASVRFRSLLPLAGTALFTVACGGPRPPAFAAAKQASSLPVAVQLPEAILVLNGKATVPWLTKDALLNSKAGAYTTARTAAQGSAVFELSMHCSRLHDTALAILRRREDGDGFGDLARAWLEAAGGDGLKPLVQHEISEALRSFKGSSGDAEFQVTMLLTWDGVGPQTPEGRGFDLYTFVQPLPRIDPMVPVAAHKAVRGNPTIKDVQWVKDRKSLEVLQKQAGVNEVLMFDDGFRVTEGLQTNFFAVSAVDGAVVTAPDDKVLSGTVRKVALEVMRNHGIAVRLECPDIRDVNSWESCFIASTSRLVKPISEVAVPDLSIRRAFSPTGSVAHRIEGLVQDAVLANSEPLKT